MESPERIGSGSQKDAFRDPESGEVITGYRHELLPQEIKSALYLNHLMHLLMPDSVINIGSAGVDLDGMAFQTSTYVPHDEIHARVQVLKMKGLKGTTREERNTAAADMIARRDEPGVQSLIQKAKENGFSVDEGGVNYIRRDDGSYIYVDCGPAFYLERDANDAYTGGINWAVDVPVAEHAIQEKLGGEELTRAQSALDRIKALSEEALQVAEKTIKS